MQNSLSFFLKVLFSRTIPYLLGAVLIFSLAAGCTPPNDTDKKATVGRLSGKVTESKTQAPIAGVDVTIGSLSTTTDGSGDYVINNVPYSTSEQSVRFEKSGYTSKTESVMIDASHTSVTQNVVLSKSQISSSSHDYKGLVVGSSGAFRLHLKKTGDQWSGKMTMILDGNTLTLEHKSSTVSGTKVDHTVENQGGANQVIVQTDTDGKSPSIIAVKLDGHPDVMAIIEEDDSDHDATTPSTHPTPDKEVLIFEGFLHDSVRYFEEPRLRYLSSDHYNFMVKGSKVKIIRKGFRIDERGVDTILDRADSYKNGKKIAESFTVTITKNMQTMRFDFLATTHGQTFNYPGRFEMSHGQVTKLIFDPFIVDPSNPNQISLAPRVKRRRREVKEGYQAARCDGVTRYYNVARHGGVFPGCDIAIFATKEEATRRAPDGDHAYEVEPAYNKSSITVVRVDIDLPDDD